jgi:hypothetical protein
MLLMERLALRMFLTRLSIDRREVEVVMIAVDHPGIVTVTDELVDAAYDGLMEVTSLHYQ